jgi:dTDP-4-amino-4,6-dideoxygalactose transaminase
MSQVAAPAVPATRPVAVPYVDLVGQHRLIKDELLAAVAEVIESGQFILGPAVTRFEEEFARLCGVAHAIGVGNGTDALVMALRALGVGPGDEVVTVPNSFVSTASAAILVGAKPVFVDVGDDYNMDPALLEAAITPATKAILPVHLTGRAARMDEIAAIACRRGLPIVEDAAQAVMAEYKGRRVGSFGMAGCFSLHPLKTLNACGDGGVITTNDAALAEKLRLMRNLGLKTRDDCVMFEGNSRLDALQAAMLLVKLRHLEAWTDARRANAAFYRKALGDVPQVRLPGERSDERAAYHTFVIQAEKRDALREFLAGRGVATNIHYPVPIHRHTAASAAGLADGWYPAAERQAGRILSLPIYPELTTVQLEAVADGIKAFYSMDSD